MTITVTAIPADSTSDSYATDTQAQAFFADEYIYAKWAAASDVDQTRAMQKAAKDIDQFIRAYSKRAIFSQSLAWPWKDGSDDADDFIFKHSPDAGTGTTTGFSVDNLENKRYPDDWFNGGSVYVRQTGDDAAPMTELRAITDYVRSTGAFTTEAFSTAIPDNSTLWIIRACPQWLIEAQCLQALCIMEDRRTDTGADINAGIQSRNSSQGGSVSYRATNTIDMSAQGLDSEVRLLIDRYLPRTRRIERA